ncbi:WD domain, G-beta repeat protein (macronuclear) [Tetrahymena thermophila SB210]|uniref:WD domain, G-beta repeat protein n=1 Tax=Tetrahymena thermophila (strain SB210) TaxID=312017 RepID=Q22AH4_TETTS|nr:WD domain, G-beta repeat protein [Tetrahymena thermophila SB210]EAR82300.1 WD domain, G-beta repeat protein [Tetrahymena thermophila SB210]|eukprot:XP_001029963.1 WD domain, G-beta repeat protein [Tetrahymena thermophila SB210]
MDLQSEENLEQIGKQQNDSSFSSQSDIQDNKLDQYEEEQKQKYQHQFEQFGLKAEIEACQQDSKEYINDISAIYLTESEREIYIHTFKKHLGHILIMVCSRNQITEIHWISDELLNKKIDKLSDQNQQENDQIVTRYIHKNRQLACLLRRVNDQIQAIIGQTDGKILFINPLTSQCTLELQFGDNIVDLLLEKHYLIFITKSKYISVVDIQTKQIVATSEQMQINSSQNCLEIIERNDRGIKFASGNKGSAVQIWSLLLQNNYSKQIENDLQNQSVQMKFMYKLDTLQVWNLTVDCLKYFKNTKQKNWMTIDYEQRNFDSSILACAGSFYDASMKYIVQIFNWKTKQLLRIIQDGHKGWVNSLKFFNDQSGYFIVGSADKNTTIYSALSGQIVKRFIEQDLVVMHALRLLNLNSEQQKQLNLSTNSVCILGVKDQDKLFIRLIF